MSQQPPSVGAGPPPPPPPPPQYPPLYGQVPYPGQPMYAPAQATNGVGIAGGVVGIVALVLFWFPLLGAIIGIVGLCLGYVGLQRAKQMGGNSKGMSITGIACGSIALVLNILIYISFAVGHSFRVGG